MEKDVNFKDIFTRSGAQYLVYDLGRRVQPIDNNLFHTIEQGQAAYPHPVQGHAHIGFIFWHHISEPFMCFFKLPLDTQSCINMEAKLAIVQHIHQQFKHDLTQELSQEQQEQLGQLPFVFKPPQDKLASLHAQISYQLKQAPSQYYQEVVTYFEHHDTQQKWENLGLQGLADFCVRMTQHHDVNQISQSLDRLPEALFEAFCHQIEHIQIPSHLAQALWEILQKTQIKSIQNACLRGLSSDVAYSTQAVTYLLNDTVELDHLIIIGARHEYALAQPELRQRYLNAIAEQDPHVFEKLFCELLALPLLKHSLHRELAQLSPSSLVGRAVCQLNQQLLERSTA
tara:strand:- start:24443 stop:25468 length:1026 start_codon:yes stop_codon:yes gene_type:complete